MGKKIRLKKKISQFLKPFKWFYPGMGVKRWLILSFIGIVLLVAGGQFLAGPTTLFRAVGILYMFLGIVIIAFGIKQIIFTFIGVLLPEREEELVDLVYQRKHLERGLKIVTIGGGTGLSTLLQGVKQYTSNLTAIVTVADEGGSSGKLRQDFDILPPGDIRNCLVALADTSPLMEDLFQYRFEGESAFSGHSFGNIFILALSQVTEGFEKAVQAASKILAIRGRVVPSSLNKIRLVAELEDGSIALGEEKITKRSNKSPIKKLSLQPPHCEATVSAIEAIKEADAIILGPGSLYTSIIPNLLIGSISEAINNSSAIKIYVCNVMTQQGESDNYKVIDHIKALYGNTKLRYIDYSVINNSTISKRLAERYAAEGSYQVEMGVSEVKKLGITPVEDNFTVVGVQEKEKYLRHNPRRLAKTIMDIISIAKTEAAHR